MSAHVDIRESFVTYCVVFVTFVQMERVDIQRKVKFLKMFVPLQLFESCSI